MSLEAKTHLDPRADRIGVTGCCCRSCELARKREYRKALLSSYDSDLMRIAARADDELAGTPGRDAEMVLTHGKVW